MSNEKPTLDALIEEYCLHLNLDRGFREREVQLVRRTLRRARMFLVQYPDFPSEPQKVRTDMLVQFLHEESPQANCETAALIAPIIERFAEWCREKDGAVKPLYMLALTNEYPIHIYADHILLIGAELGGGDRRIDLSTFETSFQTPEGLRDKLLADGWILIEEA